MNRPVTVDGISLVDFQSWRSNPVTKLVARYLNDHADALGRALVDHFLNGGDLTESHQQLVRGRILAEKEAAELEFGAIVEFYRLTDQENGNAATIAQE